MSSPPTDSSGPPSASTETFRDATAVRLVEGDPDSVGTAGARSTWEGTIVRGWDIASNASGGYLLSMAARALGTAMGRPDPVTMTAHYLSPGKPGPVSLDVQVVKQGRQFGTGIATLVAGDRPLLTCTGTFGDLNLTAGPELVDRLPPEMPDPDDCSPVVATETFPPPFMGKVELRLHPEDAGFLAGHESGKALMRGWFRLRNDEVIDSIGLLCASDAFPPTAFNAHMPVAWTPTIELTTHIRYRPQPGWQRCQFSTHFVTGGFLEEDGEIWDSRGRLVAQSRQLALVPRN